MLITICLLILVYSILGKDIKPFLKKIEQVDWRGHCDNVWSLIKDYSKKAGRLACEPLLKLWYVLDDPSTSVWDKAIIYAAIIYTISPISLLPAYLYRLLGLLDEGKLTQCVKNLFAQARYEFRTIHHIEYKFTSMMTEGMTKCKVFSLWNNAQDSFYATAFELIKIDGGSKIMIDLSIYVKYSDYTASCVMGMCETPNDVFKWLENPNSLQKCLDKIDGLIADID